MMVWLGWAVIGTLTLSPGLGQGQQAPGLEGSAQARMALGISMSEMPQAKVGAFTHWEEAGGIDPKVEGAYLEALHAWRSQDFPSVVYALVPALIKVPDYPACLHLMGHAQFRMRRHQECVAVLLRLLRVAPQLIGRTRHLGHSYVQLGRTDEAIAHYDRVLAVAPNDVQARRGRGVAHWRAGQGKKALRDLNQVVQADPSQGEAWQLRATIFYDMEELEKAQVAVERARSLRPYDPQPAFLLARILGELGQEKQAAAMKHTFHGLEVRRALLRPVEGQLLVDPWSITLLTRLAQIHMDGQDPDAASASLKRLGRAARRAGDKQTLAWVRKQQEKD